MTDLGTEHAEDLAGLHARPGPFGRTYFVHAYAESDTRALVNALWVLRHVDTPDHGGLAAAAAALLGFYGRRLRGMYALAHAADAVDAARDALAAAPDRAGFDAVLAELGQRVGELNFLVDAGLPPEALADAYSGARTERASDPR